MPAKNTNLVAVFYVNELNFKVYSKSSLFQILHFFNAGSVDVQGFVSKFLHRWILSRFSQKEWKVLNEMVRNGGHSLQFRVNFNQISQCFRTEGFFRSPVLFSAHPHQTRQCFVKNLSIVSADRSCSMQISQTAGGYQLPPACHGSSELPSDPSRTCHRNWRQSKVQKRVDSDSTERR